MKSTGIWLLFSLLSLHSFSQVAQPELDPLLSKRNFVFKAQTALPLGSQARPLTAGYDLRITRDSITSYLPFFGRAYNINPFDTEGGIKFTTTKFKYNQQKKKNTWQITIQPQNEPGVQQLYLTISPSGYATLQVISVNRQPISFNGYIDKLTP